MVGETVVEARVVVKPTLVYQIGVPTLQVAVNVELPPEQIVGNDAETAVGCVGVGVTVMITSSDGPLQPLFTQATK